MLIKKLRQKHCLELSGSIEVREVLSTCTEGQILIKEANPKYLI